MSKVLIEFPLSNKRYNEIKEDIIHSYGKSTPLEDNAMLWAIDQFHKNLIEHYKNPLKRYYYESEINHKKI